MAIAAYDSDLTSTNSGLVDEALIAANWDESSVAAWADGGTETAEANFYIQGTDCISAQFTKTGVGTLLNDVNQFAGAFTVDTDGAIIIWAFWASPASLTTYALGGIRTIVGNTLGDFYAYKASGSDFEPNPFGGWYNYAVDPASAAIDSTVGAPDDTWSIVGIAINATAQSRGNPFAVDAIRVGRCTLEITAGDATAYGTFTGMGDFDTSTTQRYALFQKIFGGFKWQGLMSLGVTATAVDFRDSNASIFVANTPQVSVNFNKIEVHNASSNIEWTSISISSQDGVENTIAPTASRGSFIAVDNATINKFSCTFTDMGTFTYLSNSTLDGCTYRRCDAVSQNGATFTGCTFVDHQASTGSPATLDAALLVDNLTVITDCTFIGTSTGSPAGAGHAIEITAAAAVGSPTSFDLSGNTFENFGADGTTDAAIYNNSGTQIILNILSGGTPTVRNGVGSSTIINNSVTLLVQGLTEGAAVKIVANETVGTITLGDVILETLANLNGEANTSLNYEGAFEPSGLDVITRCRSSGLPTAAMQDDNGVFTDETSNANKANASSMNLLPTTPVVNEDRYLFGHAEKFNNMKIDINTAGTGGFTITWQYWNGAWTDLTGVVDDTSSFSALGENYISFTMPGDWTTTSINSQGPYYYVRAAYTAGTVTVVPLGTRCSLDVDKYLPFVQDGTVTAAGLTVTASWNRDTIATF